MTIQLQIFQAQALEALAQTIGDFYTGSQISELFRTGGAPDLAHDGGTKWRWVKTAFEQLQQRSGNQPHAVLQILKTACNPQGWIGRREEYERLLGGINEVLAFYGLVIRDTGDIQQVGATAKTVSRRHSDDEAGFDSRSFHPQVVLHGRSHFVRGAYFHAVFECCKAFNLCVQLNAGLAESGQPLMSKAMAPSGPMKFNRQATQSEQDEQQGIMFLSMGLMNAVRNPQAHEPELKWPMSREDALDVLALVSFLYRKLGTAVVLNQPGQAARQIQL